MALGVRIPSAFAVAAVAVIVPVTLPFIYLTCLKYSVSRNTTSTHGSRIRVAATKTSIYRPSVQEPFSLPEDVKDDALEWVVAYERVVSHPIPASNLRFPVLDTSSESSAPATATTTKPSALLAAYQRATHVAFSWTPQAFLIRSLIGEVNVRRSFDADWIEDLSFTQGDLVNGVYRVSHYGFGGAVESERSELLIEVPASYTGPKATGLLVTTIETVPANRNSSSGNLPEEAKAVFVNETWMWRRKEEKLTMLETPFGKWFHAILAAWLVNKGMKAVLETEHGKRK